MARTVQFYEYGGPDVLRVVDVPAPSPGQVQVPVRALREIVPAVLPQQQLQA